MANWHSPLILSTAPFGIVKGNRMCPQCFTHCTYWWAFECMDQWLYIHTSCLTSHNLMRWFFELIITDLALFGEFRDSLFFKVLVVLYYVVIFIIQHSCYMSWTHLALSPLLSSWGHLVNFLPSVQAICIFNFHASLPCILTLFSCSPLLMHSHCTILCRLHLVHC